jgi:hypothetical protein
MIEVLCFLIGIALTRMGAETELAGIKMQEVFLGLVRLQSDEQTVTPLACVVKRG